MQQDEAKSLIDKTDGLIVILGKKNSGKSTLADTCKHDIYFSVDKDDEKHIHPRQVRWPRFEKGLDDAVSQYYGKVLDMFNTMTSSMIIVFDTIDFFTYQYYLINVDYPTALKYTLDIILALSTKHKIILTIQEGDRPLPYMVAKTGKIYECASLVLRTVDVNSIERLR